VITIAGDKRADVDAYSTVLDALFARYPASDGGPALRAVGADLVGDTLGGALNGHEHFGFKDGVSQPALRGRPISDANSYITERTLDPAQPEAALFGRPGQVLIWPGQLLLGQPRQSSLNPLEPLDPLPLPAPWLGNGSFMVLRVLAQDVPAFWTQIRSWAQDVLQNDATPAADWIGSRVVGRWRSGAPVMRSPTADNPAFVADNRIVNDFGFRAGGKRPNLLPSQEPLPQLPLSQPDPRGVLCPLAGHIRKVNPRDDPPEQGSPSDTLTRLIGRRGVPYGPAFPDPQHAVADGVERGLIFVSYQASIEHQFEFLMQNWVNGDDEPLVAGGRDAVLGRHAAQNDAPPTFVNLADQVGMMHRLPQLIDFITPRGGGYFFAPSIAGLKALAAGTAG
jgi:Dyp-type peroxidase family